MRNSDRCILTLIIVFLAIAIAIFQIAEYDSEVLTHHVEEFFVADKWHNVDCYPIYTINPDGISTYAGESCSEQWTLMYLSSVMDGLPNIGRVELNVSNHDFTDLKVGSKVHREFDSGRLGFTHNETFKEISQ